MIKQSNIIVMHIFITNVAQVIEDVNERHLKQRE